MPPVHNITILGGGLTGLTTAYRLARALRALPASIHGAHKDTRVTLLEKSERIGGWVDSRVCEVEVEGRGKVEVVLEAGPRSIRPKGGIGAAYMLKLVSRRFFLFRASVVDFSSFARASSTFPLSPSR